MNPVEVINIILLLLIAIISIAILWPTNLKPLQYRYKHPENAIGVGPVWTKEQGPPLHYMYIWKEDQRLKMEFRNLPGVVIACYEGVIPELSEAIKKLS